MKNHIKDPVFIFLSLGIVSFTIALFVLILHSTSKNSRIYKEKTILENYKKNQNNKDFDKNLNDDKENLNWENNLTQNLDNNFDNLFEENKNKKDDFEKEKLLLSVLNIRSDIYSAIKTFKKISEGRELSKEESSILKRLENSLSKTNNIFSEPDLEIKNTKKKIVKNKTKTKTRSSVKKVKTVKKDLESL